MTVEVAVRDYHVMFTDIHSEALRVVREIKERGLWRVGKEEGYRLLGEMFGELSRVYGISAPRGPVEASHEHYLIPAERIGLPKVSLISALHEYRHHMQKYHHRRYEDIEVDARAWSISAFHLALPEDFDRAWRAGRIWYMPPHPGD